MNDPGTAEPIKEAAEDLDPKFVDKEKQTKRKDSGDLSEKRDYRDPNRYWLESTACPLIAGTFGPMATAFSICALSSSWRVYIPPGGTVNNSTTIDDPKWLLAINGLSLACALIANGSLLLNMSRRLKFAIAQPITIIGFLLSSCLLIVDLAVLTSSHTYQLSKDAAAAPAQRHALTSAFYYGIMAAVIYLVITMLMCLTVWGVYKGHYARHFNLTVAQRTLMLQTMSFFTYLLLGALVFSHIEGWEYLDAVYWADVTLLTVGLGDYSPATHTGRSLFLFFAIGGIVIIGLVIGSIRTLILERGSKKISARMMEKKRLRAVDSLDHGKQRMRISRFQTIKFSETYTNISRKREQEFDAMRTVQDCAERDRKWMALALSTTAAFTLWFAGAAIFHAAETQQGWTYFQCLYFAYTCLLTIGYGDFEPLSNSGRAFFVLWTLLAVPTLTILISDMSDTVVQLFSGFTMWIGSLTVLPGDPSVRTTAKSILKQLPTGKLHPKDIHSRNFEGEMTEEEEREISLTERIADRMTKHLKEEELHEALMAESTGDTLERDTHFYHFILAREIQRLMKDLDSKPSKRYTWGEWEYFLRLMSTDDTLVPPELRLPETRAQFDNKQKHHRFSWLSGESPLMGYKSETEWVLEKLGDALEAELKGSTFLAYAGGRRRRRSRPPVSMDELIRKGKKGRGRDVSEGKKSIEEEVGRRLEP